MNAQPDSSIAYLEVIFDKRNKSYGAYSLRRSYPDRLNLAVLISISIIALIFITPLLLSKNARESILTITCGSCSDPIILEDWEEQLRRRIQPPASSEPAQQPNNNDSRRTTPLVVTYDADSIQSEDPNANTNPDPITTNTVGNGTSTTTTGTDNDGGTGTEGDDGNITTGGTVYEEYGIDQYPEFAGGMAAYYKYMQKHIVYPKEALEYNVEGTVYLQVVVEKDGTIRNTKVVKDIGFGCGAEAKRVVEGMPKWRPGKVKGKSVPVRLTLRVKFSVH